MREDEEPPTSLEDGTSTEPGEGPLDDPDVGEPHGVPADRTGEHESS